MRKFALLLTALALAGCAGSSGPREVRVAVTEKGFEPAKIEVAKGTETTLVITRKTNATCATEAIFQETGRRYDLPLNEDVRILLPTDAPVTLHYACGMDMIRGEIVVK
ncbi:MAG: cupredoxin domain-containing protein [Candidatus Eisenbacteria bacterium]|uniref:Cupredoxin domain-containing protein n=1 Tax=Eiseniibacteriota bacterium TaxID=2212470 RepID=A0A933S9A7_UNCEI|nr:cupredoxin domain-containing protein [Candidatus Eisenbacteria bacterium]